MTDQSLNELAAHQQADHRRDAAPKIVARNVNVFYGSKKAIDDVSIEVNQENVTAFMGPSGCGKATLLRTTNRMNDTISTARRDGTIEFDGENI